MTSDPKSRWTVRATCAALALCVATFAPPAEASVFTVEKRVEDNLYASTGARRVGLNTLSGTFNAGGFDLTTADGPLGDFIAFCLDLAAHFSSPSDYKVTEDPFAGNGQGSLSQDRVDLIQNLYDSSYDGLVEKNHWAGFQLALWEIVAETVGTFDASGGNIYQAHDHRRALIAEGMANDYLAAAQQYDGAKKYSLIFLESQDGDGNGVRDSQNLVTVVDHIAQVPLPAAGLLMVVALAGGAAAYRRRKTT